MKGWRNSKPSCLDSPLCKRERERAKKHPRRSLLAHNASLPSSKCVDALQKHEIVCDPVQSVLQKHEIVCDPVQSVLQKHEIGCDPVQSASEKHEIVCDPVQSVLEKHPVVAMCDQVKPISSKLVPWPGGSRSRAGHEGKPRASQHVDQMAAPCPGYVESCTGSGWTDLPDVSPEYSQSTVGQNSHLSRSDRTAYSLGRMLTLL